MSATARYRSVPAGAIPARPVRPLTDAERAKVGPRLATDAQLEGLAAHFNRR